MKDADILVVDDEPELCEVVSSLLTRSGNKVITASNAMEAETILAEQIPPLIICDISMPGKTGFEFVADMKAKGLPCAVVMLTAHFDKERLLEALRLGCVDYLTKPFDAKQLVEDVKVWLEMGRTLQSLSKEKETISPFDKSILKLDLLRVKANQLRKKNVIP